MFDGILTRLRNAIADAVSKGIEDGVRNGCKTVFGPLAGPLTIEDHADDDKSEPAATNGTARRKAGAR